MPASILIAVLSHLPHLRALRLKGAPSSAILEILTFLPHLVTLDTEYFGQATFSRYDDVPAASLKELTVRTSSVHIQGFQQLWTWIRRLTPRPSLESFTLNAFSIQGESFIPRGFILDMANTHRDTLRHFTADSMQMTLKDIECLCTVFPSLETLSCSTLFTPEGVSGSCAVDLGLRFTRTLNKANWPAQAQYEESVAKANKLREIRMNMNNWMPSNKMDAALYMEVARKAMLREGSVLRAITLGCNIYRVCPQCASPVRESDRVARACRVNGFTKGGKTERTVSSSRSCVTSCRICGIDFR